MKILYNIAGTRHSGGMERVLANKANWLVAHGYEVIIVTTDQCGEAPFFPLDERIRCIDLAVNYEANNGKGLWRKLLEYPAKQRKHKKGLLKVLKDERPDVCVSMFCNDVSFLADLKDGSRKVLEVHFSKFKRTQYARRGLWHLADWLRSKNDEKLVRKFDRFVVLTEEDKEYWGDVPQMVVIPNAQTFCPSEVAPLTAKKALAVGRLAHQKGFSRLIEAWSMVYASHPDWSLDIIGEGEEKGALEQQIAKLGLEKSITIVPPTQDIEGLYMGASLQALSSRYEGLPMTLIEAQSCGLPAVAFACQCGPRDIIRQGENGILVEEGDVQGLAEGMCKLMDDENLRQQMGQSARLLSKRYEEDPIMAKWTQMFEDLTSNKKTIVISAVNLRKGGTLTILRQCLEHLSSRMQEESLRVVALVHKKELCEYPGVEYIEMPWTIKSWILRLWCEYVTMYRVSKQLGDVYLWFSLHDTTPNVKAERRAVYCHNPFPFFKCKWTDILLNYHIFSFSLFSKIYYRINIHKNNYVVVQQQWIKDSFKKMFSLGKDDIIVTPPPTKAEAMPLVDDSENNKIYHFVFASFGDIHKNFEVLCEATSLLEKEIGANRFKTTITVSAKDNSYTKKLYKKWGCTESLEFAGFMPREQLFSLYAHANCMVFPSKAETWGLPISEFAVTGKPMLLADLPYAHETAAGCEKVGFFDPESAEDLKEKMLQLVNGDNSPLQSVPSSVLEQPVAYSWQELFDKLLAVQ